MSTLIYKDFAFRLYINQKFGNPMGGGSRNPYKFTGSVSFANTPIRYHYDLADFDHLDRSVPELVLRDTALHIAQEHLGYTPYQSQAILAAQLFHIDGVKVWITGLVLYNTATQKGHFAIWDEQANLVCESDLYFRSCKASSGTGKAPDLLATNYDVRGGQHKATVATSTLMSGAQALEILRQRAQR